MDRNKMAGTVIMVMLGIVMEIFTFFVLGPVEYIHKVRDVRRYTKNQGGSFWNNLVFNCQESAEASASRTTMMAGTVHDDVELTSGDVHRFV